MSLISILDNDIDEILRDIVSKMSFKVCVTATEVIDDTTFKVYACNTQHLRKCSAFDVESISYDVVDFVQDEYLIIKGSTPITECFTLPAPYYLTGSPVLTSTELKQLQSDLSRMPFVWLLETFETDFVANTNDPTGAVSRLRLFVFDVADAKTWLNSDHRMEVIRPMKALGDNLLQSIDQDKRVVEVTNYKVIDRVDYGNYAVNRGNVKSILPEQLSGIEIIIEIPIFASVKCVTSKCK